jgi:Glyoxalase-like domain
MAVTLGTVVIDALDPVRVGTFWSQVLGWETAPDPDGDLVVRDPSGRCCVELLILKVPDPKVVKNRLHLDLHPSGVDQGTELDRLVALGAVPVDIGQGDPSWIVLADPEGNEFCLLSAPGRAD